MMTQLETKENHNEFLLNDPVKPLQTMEDPYSNCTGDQHPCQSLMDAVKNLSDIEIDRQKIGQRLCK